MCIEHCTYASVVTLSSLPEPSLESIVLFEKYQVESLRDTVPAVYSCTCDGNVAGLDLVKSGTQESLSPATHEHGQTHSRELLICKDPTNEKCRRHNKNNSTYIDQHHVD